MNKQSLRNRGNLKNTNSITHRSSITNRLTITHGETDALVCASRDVWSSELFWKWPPSCQSRRQDASAFWFSWRPTRRTRLRRGRLWQKGVSLGALSPRDWRRPRSCLPKTPRDWQRSRTASSGDRRPSTRLDHPLACSRRRCGQLGSWKDLRFDRQIREVSIKIVRQRLQMTLDVNDKRGG